MATKRDFSVIHVDQDGDGGEQPTAKRLIELRPCQTTGLLPMASTFPSFLQPPSSMFAPLPPPLHHPQQGFVPFQRKDDLSTEGGGDSGAGSDDMLEMENRENGEEEKRENDDGEEEDEESEDLFELEVTEEGEMIDPGEAAAMQLTPEAYQPAPLPLNADTVVANVAGRLRLLNDAHKFPVTIGELSRRIDFPECLNTSILGAIMRRAKSKEGGKDLSDMLLNHGIYIPSGRRKNVPNTSFTCLIEEEARQLANDLNAVYEREWNAAQFAQEKARRALAAGIDPSILHHRALIGAKAIEDQLAFFHGCQYEYESDQTTAHPDFRHYALITHEFGWRAHCAALEAQRRMMLEEARIYAALIATSHRQQQQQQNSAAFAQNPTMREPQDRKGPHTE